jgi:hypothetical protein
MTGDAEAPFGGQALARLGRLRDPKMPLTARAAGFVSRRWPALLSLALLVAATASIWRLQVRRENDPVLRATQLLAAKSPLAALAELDKLSDDPRARSPQVQVLRGKAEHALGQLGMAFADFAAALDSDPASADPQVVSALVNDLDSEAFPQQWRPALVRVLGEKVGEPAADGLRSLIRSQRGKPRRDALEALETMGRATDDDRLAMAEAELGDPASPCPSVLNAIRVLVVAGNERAQWLLNKTAEENRRCGSREASDALRRIQRAASEGNGPPPDSAAGSLDPSTR